jgi:hypothetical protein
MQLMPRQKQIFLYIDTHCEKVYVTNMETMTVFNNVDAGGTGA